MDPVDFGKTASDYATHRQGFPAIFFERLGSLGVVHEGTRALDLGTGTGTVARGLAALGARVTALDPSADLLVQAARLAEQQGLELRTHVGQAESTGLESASFDLVTAGQCWHWFDAVAACAELARLLAPNGRVVVAAFDWLPLEGSIAAATERLIEAHNPHWTMGGGDGRHPEWRSDLETAGFRIVQEHFEVLPVRYTKEAWMGRIRASAGVGASLSPAAIEDFDAQHSTLLDGLTSSDELEAPHSLAFCVASEGVASEGAASEGLPSR